MSLFKYPQTGQTAPGSYVRGVWTEASSTPLSFLGTIQPMSGKEITSLNVGREDTGKVKVYSTTPLNVSIKGSSNSGDIVFYQSKKWEVIHELDFQNKLLPHFKYVAEYRGELT